MSLAGFVKELIQTAACHELGLDLIRCRYTNSLGRVLVWNECPTPLDAVLVIHLSKSRDADKLWSIHQAIQQIARPYGWRKIELRGDPLKYEILIQEERNMDELGDSNLSPRERDVLAQAIVSGQSFAVVRLADNHVIFAGQGILKFSSVPAGCWPGFDITPLWIPHDASWADYQAGTVPRSPDLDRIYKLLEYRPGNTGQQIRDIEYVAYRSRYENGKIVRGDRARFVADIWRLDNYFGEPCRLCMAKHSEVLPSF